MKRAAAVLCLVACGLHASAQSPRLLASTEFQTHFEPNPGAAPTSGSRDGWESFPLSQEAGYDPSIQPETSAGMSVLARELAPTRDGFFQLGFVRRVHLVAGDHASIRFRLRAPYLAHATPAHLHVFRGERDEQHDFTLNGGEWQQLSTKLDASAVPITAIAIDVDFPGAVHTRAERVLLTDLHLHALATKHIAIVEPAALWDSTREFFYLQRSLTPGEEIFLRAASSTRWTITAPEKIEAAHGTGSAVHYRLPHNAQAGIWTVHLEDSTAESTALLLVRPDQPKGLIFDAPPTIAPQLLASIRDRKAQLEKVTVADAGRNVALMSRESLLPGLPSYFAEVLQPSELALMDAMLFRAAGDREALDQARTLLRSMAGWATWVHPWFPAHGYHSYYPVGLMTKYIVMTTQFLGPDLPADERVALDHALIALSVRPAYEEYVQEDRLQFNYSNWIGNTVGGALLAALSSSDRDVGGYALGLFVKERDHVFAAYTSDGSYGESITYHRFDLETTELASAAAKRLLGVSIDAPLLNGERYMRYAAINANALLDYGDSHLDLRPSNVFAYIAALNQSPNTVDFYFRYRDEGTAQILPRVLWEAKIRPVSKPDPGPPSTLFAERGIAVLRENWMPDSTVLAMRAGRNFNHNHADEGSIFYASHGVMWIDEAGYADYYKDPNYNSYNTQSIGHNTLLVDNNPESQVLAGNDVLGVAPRFTHTFFSGPADVAQADLSSVYPSLTHYTRTLIRLPGGTAVVVDDAASEAPHIFSIVWHLGQKVAEYSQERNALQLTDDRDAIAVSTFADSAIDSALIPSPFPLAAYERTEHGPVDAPLQWEVSRSEPASAALFVTLLQPQSRVQAKWKAEGGGYALWASGWTLRIARTPQHTLAMRVEFSDGKTVDLVR